MKIAVTGGTGFVGRVLVEELIARGHEVAVLSRGVADVKLDRVQRSRFNVQCERNQNNREGATYIKGNVATGDGLDELLTGKDVLIHLVGLIREKGSNTFEAVHFRGAVNAIAAAGRNGVNRILHMSALGTRKDAVSRYHITKWRGEEAVKASGRKWTIFRPSIIVGPDDSFVNMLAGAMRKTPVFMVPGKGENLMQPVSVSDVARAFADSLETVNTVQRVLELGGPDVLTFKDILNIIAKTIDKKRVFIRIPSSLLLPLVMLSDVLKLPFPISRDQLIMLGEDNIVTDASGMELLGSRFRKFADGIGEYL